MSGSEYKVRHAKGGAKSAEEREALPHELIDGKIRATINRSPKYLRHSLGLMYGVLIVIGVIGIFLFKDGLSTYGLDGLASGCIKTAFFQGTEQPCAADQHKNTGAGNGAVAPAAQIAVVSAPTGAIKPAIPSRPVVEAVSMQPSASKTYIVANDANLLATPEPYGSVVGSVQVGETVTVVSGENQDPVWVHVTTDGGQTGYIQTQDLFIH